MQGVFNRLNEMVTDMKKPIRIVTLLGTVRPKNYTAMALDLVIDQCRQHPRVTVDAVDPAKLTLAFPGGAAGNEDAKMLTDTVANATGVILATPEYHGTFSAVMKLLIENLGFPSVLAGKPVALLGVAAGSIGAIKSLEQLRGVCSHVGAMVLPGPVSVSNVRRVFDEDGNCSDEAVEKRVRGVATTLIDYIEGAVCPRVALEEMVRARIS